MRYYEVFVADSRYRRDTPLTYAFADKLAPGQVVTVPLRGRPATAFVLGEVDKPNFATKDIKTVLSSHLLPAHLLELANWLKNYYFCTLGEALRQFAPSAPVARTFQVDEAKLVDPNIKLSLQLERPLTKEQEKAIAAIQTAKTTSVLLHGQTGSGKTRVYMELTKKTLDNGRCVILLTPEIALTSQLFHIFSSQLAYPIYVLHSQLPPARRKKIWLAILEAAQPVVVIGPRSALFSPVKDPGLIILDEAHEPAYKQEQSPRYHAVRVASQLGLLTNSKVILGTATPSVADYYLASERGAVARMSRSAIDNSYGPLKSEVIDIKDRTSFKKDPYLSEKLIAEMTEALEAKRQVMIYLNRRGSARLILCSVCGWQALCPNCDVPLVYHGDEHLIRCHICGYKQAPPTACLVCANPDIVYKSIGTKALLESAAKLFPQYRLQRFDSDNVSGERIHELYQGLRSGEIDVLIGTQVLAKGFDLPKLGLVGVVAAETSLALPDYTSEERSFQLLYQVMGRVGRGHGHGKVIVQTYNPDNVVVRATLERDYQKFYQNAIVQRRQFRFPPFSYLLKLVCRRATANGAEKAAGQLSRELAAQKLQVEIIGPTPSFYARRGSFYYWQIVVKSKDRDHLLKLSKIVPANWMIDLDPMDLL